MNTYPLMRHLSHNAGKRPANSDPDGLMIATRALDKDDTMTDTRLATRLVSAAAALALMPVAAQAEDWEYSAAIYGWGPDTGIDVSTPVGEISGELSFADAWEALDLALMGAFTAQSGRLGFILDGMVLKLSDNRATPGVLGFTGAELSSDVRIINAYVTWQLVEYGTGRLDVVGGARFYNTESNVTLTGGAGPAAFTISDDWVDPVLGMRYRTDFNERWYGSLFADVGGFGTGSEFTWQGVVLVGYRFSDSFSIEGGYRVLQSDRIEANGEIDIDMSGPVIGARWRF
jgi:hypothetical protein